MITSIQKGRHGPVVLHIKLERLALAARSASELRNKCTWKIDISIIRASQDLGIFPWEHVFVVCFVGESGPFGHYPRRVGLSSGVASYANGILKVVHRHGRERLTHPYDDVGIEHT